ncbi:SWIRM domain [Teratosphaeria destructans]|uniref:SWIRM domain n=1 Tax=Teratosphaeria destructans TaxID=418781 RepID=A0A9W7W6U6_9PEZI|nr:SWIRM domain [Teratosphaeria destructans]
MSSLREETKNKKWPLGLGNLLSPEENTADSFEPGVDSLTTKLPPLRIHSPPTPPQEASLQSFSAQTPSQWAHRDAPLFSVEKRADTPHSQAPLFGSDRPGSSSSTVHAHRLHSGSTSTPTQHERLPAGQVDTNWLNRAIKGMGVEQYLRKLGEENAMYRTQVKENAQDATDFWSFQRSAITLPEPRQSPALERDDITKAQLSRLNCRGGVSKPKAKSTLAKPPRPAKASKTSPAESPLAAPSKPAKTPVRSPRKRISHDMDRDSSAEPRASSKDKEKAEPKHKRSQATKKTDGPADKDWRDIPDYSPSFDLLPPKSSLGCTWKGGPLDIRGDVDFDQLHPIEAEAATVLRLPPSTWLANKRRLFAARVNALREGKTAFNRTMAQQALPIDVNKASRIQDAFEKLGWFDLDRFTPFLTQEELERVKRGFEREKSVEVKKTPSRN